jgi:hypothetical protein
MLDLQRFPPTSSVEFFLPVLSFLKLAARGFPGRSVPRNRETAVSLGGFGREIGIVVQLQGYSSDSVLADSALESALSEMGFFVAVCRFPPDEIVLP